MQTHTFNKMMLESLCVSSARTLFNKEFNNELTTQELNSIIAHVIKDDVIAPKMEKAMSLYSRQRIAVYESMEFLTGRLDDDRLINTGLEKEFAEVFAKNGIEISRLEDLEDAALGNGGLGRLAACFMESAATLGYPVYGEGLYYKYGLFKQTFDSNGNQVEIPDDWTANGEPWFEPHYDDSVIVEFSDTKVKAVPYVVPIIGYNENPESFVGNVFPLTLWKAEPIEGVTNHSASRISDYLYPSDGDDEGKKLRIRQEYFFTSATMQRIFKIHLQKHGTLDNIEDYYIFQMNDTHPVFGCLEFIRLFKMYNYSFDVAFEKAKKCFAYTNHTVLSEALEKWPIHMFKELLPSLWRVIEELNQKLIDELLTKTEFYLGVVERTPNWKFINEEYELFDKKGMIHMSRIACFVANKINGVAAVHTEILKSDVLARWYKLYPEKFNNKTNGVTPRRWIKLANPELARFLDKYLGKGWVTNLSMLEKLEQFKNNLEVLDEFAAVKNCAKIHLIDYVEKHEGIRIPFDSVIYCQIKRIHKYKRQDMTALAILYLYDKLKKGELPDFHKSTFIIGGKAAASYWDAKRRIALLKDIQDMVNNDPDVNDKLTVVFVTNYNVSYAERLCAGSNFSLQISTAGKEASGTGNMKAMLNGAPTLGTWDGANIEIFMEASTKNNYPFGATVDEFKRIEPSHSHQRFLEAKGNRELVALFDYLEGKRSLKGTYKDIADDLRYKDEFFVMYDLKYYIDAILEANHDYAKEQATGDRYYYTRKCLKNTAHSGKFSSDRTIQEYVDDIWHLEKVQ